ncbi:hypothetical protein G5B37_00540 [Rasiella rasia]|uniref:Uncharacterized protein n=1 Tax=Rasiella rasia TaxID=2744027 RepID=A0A6G6GHQ3_9FLAO|nr:hypothetical protein [Rasiella rasia]QIE58105.1 hypothetical protein G5B37_00540 [Rasiella rasia]
MTAIIVCLSGLVLVWEYFNGGVKTHYMLQSDDLPGISNYWNLLVIAILSWCTLFFVSKRTSTQDATAISSQVLKKALKRCLVACAAGIALGILFLSGLEQATNALMLGLFLVSFIIPIYKFEYLLGFVLGLTYAVGATLPTFFGLILIGIFYITYHVPRWVYYKLKPRNN